MSFESDVDGVGEACDVGAEERFFVGEGVCGVLAEGVEQDGAGDRGPPAVAFVAAGAVTLASALFTGLWLVKSEPAEISAPPTPKTGSERR